MLLASCLCIADEMVANSRRALAHSNASIERGEAVLIGFRRQHIDYISRISGHTPP